jgi:hypothetical protein
MTILLEDHVYSKSVQTPKVFRVLSLLDKKKYKSFLKFLDSPYLNTNRKLYDFAVYLFKFYPTFSSRGLSKEHLDDFLFPGTKYNRKRITDYLSDLNKKLEFFMKIETLKSSESIQKHVLINAFDSPGFYDLFYKEIKRHSEQLKDEKVRGPNRYRLIAELGERLLFHPEFFAKKNEEEHEMLMNVMENLDMDFAFSKLRLITFFYSKKEFLTAEYSPNFLDLVLELSNKEFSKKHIGFKIYLDLLSLQKTSGDCVLFNKVSTLFFENAEMLSVGDRKNIFICLANYCVKSINLELEGFVHDELLNLYDRALEKKILIYNGQLSDSTFNNIAIAAIRAGKFDYANTFIEQYEHFLGENIRTTAVRYCKAIICYELKRFDEAIGWLDGANKHSEIRYKIQWRFLFVKIYFEQNKEGGWSTYELLESFLDSFSVFLRRNEELSSSKKSTYMDFVKFTKQLMKIHPYSRYDQADIDKLRDTIKNSRTIGKQWLLEQLKKVG